MVYFIPKFYSAIFARKQPIISNETPLQLDLSLEAHKTTKK